MLICLLEYTAGIVAAIGRVGTLDGAPDAAAATSMRPRPWAVMGLGLGVVVWFGLFATLGGAGFQMWQTPARQTLR